MGYSHGISWNYVLAEEYINNLGYELIVPELIDKHCNIANKFKLTIKDKEGYLFYISIGGIQKNIRRNSRFNKFDKGNLYSIQNIKLWCKLENKPFKLINNQIYEGNRKYLKWECLKEECKETFDMTWGNISSGYGCSYCKGFKVGLSNCLATKNPQLTLEWHPIKNGDLTPYMVAYGSNDYAWWQCKVNHKHEWYTQINIRTSQNTGCPYCSVHPLPSEDYNLLVINPTLCEEWNYSKNDKNPQYYTPNSNEKVWWKCKECDREWEAGINSRNKVNGTCCPECSESKGEKIITKFLKLNNIYYIPQKTFKGLVGLGGGNLSYDFYLPKYNLLIEFQGRFHDTLIRNYKNEPIELVKARLKQQKEHDRRKKEYALANGYNFLEIWYKDFNNIEDILKNELRD